jgi:hypothetical protein
VPDPLAEKSYSWSPYRYGFDNPVNITDPDGMMEDGYKDLYGNYKWFDSEKEAVIQKDEKLWLHITDNKSIFEMAKAGIFDNIPEQTDQGEIKVGIDNLTTFEMWLDSPSESIGEGIGKGTLDILYSFINSPSILLTGRTLGGTVPTPKQRMDAFVDFVPGLLTGGLTKTGQVVKTTKKGLQGFNRFVKRTPGITTTEGLPAGMKWQQRAGKLYQINKVNQQGLKSLDKARNLLNVLGTSKNEFAK